LCTSELCFDVDPATGYGINVPAEKRPDCCFVQKLRVPQMNGGKFSIKSKATESAADAVEMWNPSCQDALDSGLQYDILLRGAVGDAVNSVDPSACPASGKCPSEAPMCRNGGCVTPTCQLVAKYCHIDNIAGVVYL
jgi:hypothetical protein